MADVIEPAPLRDPAQHASALAVHGSLERAGMISSRIDRLPFSAWHARSLGVIGTAHFFDAFDALAIAFVLPILMTEWKLTTGDAAMAIAIGYFGQMIGAIALGRAAESYGRLRVLRWSLFLMSVLSLGLAAAGGLAIFLVLRFVQGIGLGGEVPVAATYINEICPSRLRGRVVFALQTVFAFGVLMTALAAVWIIPHFGWRAMFVIGGLPLLLAILLPRLLPESPRWLAERGRVDEASGIVALVETRLVARGRSLAEPNPVPTPTGAVTARLGDLLRDGYATRSVSTWVIAICVSIAGFGIVSWMPTLYRTVFGLPLDQTLRYSAVTAITSFLGALIATGLIDLLGRRWSFIIGFGGGALPLLYLGYVGIAAGPLHVMLLTGLANLLLSFILAGIYVYAPEIYPTRMRALGAGAASACLRVGAIVGPLTVGWLLPLAGIGAVFLLFGGAALVGAFTVFCFAIETKGRSLEEIAP